jgi:hypothetical protein
LLLTEQTLLSFALNVMIAALYLVLISVAGLWLALPREVVLLFFVLLIAAAIGGVRRLRSGSRYPREGWARVGLIAQAALAAVITSVTLLALSGRRPFAETSIDLRFPLEDGTYLVANGGSHQIVNFHLETLEGERARPYRGQSYAVDIVEVGRWGTRLSELSPDDPKGFAIFGDVIHAPCSGEVVHAVDGQPDQAPGEPPLTLPGNHVILACDGSWIVLAHMMRNSVAVEPGEKAASGDTLGRVGNSGASGEPHLHIHAQRPGTELEPLGGDPLPVTFGGRHLVRNDRVDQP